MGITNWEMDAVATAVENTVGKEGRVVGKHRRGNHVYLGVKVPVGDEWEVVEVDVTGERLKNRGPEIVELRTEVKILRALNAGD